MDSLNGLSGVVCRADVRSGRAGVGGFFYRVGGEPKGDKAGMTDASGGLAIGSNRASSDELPRGFPGVFVSYLP